MSSTNGSRPDARTSLLTRLFDDAGMYPPASLSIGDAVAAHRVALSGPHAWIAGRFVCSASLLEQLAPLVAEDSWPLTVLLDDVDAVGRFTAGAPAARIEQLEIKAAPSVDAALDRAMPIAELVGADVIVEIPAGDVDAVELLAAVPGVGAKIRCAGADAAAIPAAVNIARTISACSDFGVRMKATAGLHSPFPHPDAATGGAQHGFLNLLAACAFVGELTEAELVDLLGSREITLDATGLRFAGEIANPDACMVVRRDLFAGIGSCSFDEPVAALIELGVLE